MSPSETQSWIDVVVSWKGLGLLVLFIVLWNHVTVGIANVISAARERKR